MKSTSQLLDEFSYKIYEPPLSEIRDSGEIRNLANPLAVLMLLIDFLTEVEMNGIHNFIGNSTGLYASETIDALRLVGCDPQADCLSEILSVAKAAGMTHDNIQQDRSVLSEFQVASFDEIHGDKWEAALEAIDDLEICLDYDGIREVLEPYVSKHRSVFESTLGSR